jgi:branched-chain amino acid transport system ATP-binding protein
MTALLEVSGISASYGHGPRVLHDINLNLSAGDTLGVLGMNGAGKSTLIRAINGELRPSAGTVRFAGKDLRGRSSAERVRSGIVTMPEGHRIIQPLTVQENLELATLRIRRRQVRRVLSQHLPMTYELFPILAERRNQLAGLLSGGEQQMLALARSLMADPKILLMDEPSLGLAPAVVARIYDVLAALAHRGLTMLIVEQSPLRLQKVCGRLIVLREGKISAESRASEMSETALRRAYFG